MVVAVPTSLRSHRAEMREARLHARQRAFARPTTARSLLALHRRTPHNTHAQRSCSSAVRAAAHRPVVVTLERRPPESLHRDRPLRRCAARSQPQPKPPASPARRAPPPADIGNGHASRRGRGSRRVRGASRQDSAADRPERGSSVAALSTTACPVSCRSPAWPRCSSRCGRRLVRAVARRRSRSCGTR